MWLGWKGSNLQSPAPEAGALPFGHIPSFEEILYNNIMIKAYEIQISGRVQDVGFRYTAQQMAHSLGIVGRVQNLADGTVLIHAEGEEDKLEQFLQWCQQGPDRAKVNRISYKSVEVENFQDFKVTT